jgi:hypothetical protein
MNAARQFKLECPGDPLACPGEPPGGTTKIDIGSNGDRDLRRAWEDTHWWGRWCPPREFSAFERQVWELVTASRAKPFGDATFVQAVLARAAKTVDERAADFVRARHDLQFIRLCAESRIRLEIELWTRFRRPLVSEIALDFRGGAS